MTFSPHRSSYHSFHCSSDLFYDRVLSSMKLLNHDDCVIYCLYGDLELKVLTILRLLHGDSGSFHLRTTKEAIFLLLFLCDDPLLE